MTTPDPQAAPQATAISPTPSFLRLKVTELCASPDNPRRIDPKDPKLAELAESLRTLGQIEPIVVRAIEHPDLVGMILAGERRWRAAQLAGLPEIECKVLHCDDRTALEITVVENMQRSDLTPMEEAKGVRRLLDAGWPTEEIAAHLGKSPAWVTLRSRLTDLCQAWRDTLATGKLDWCGVAHLEQVARLPEDTQVALLGELQDSYELSAKDLARLIQDHYLHQLSQAAWKLDDATLVPAAGACTTCPHRSGHQQTLFADVTGKDRCLQSSCWQAKAAAVTLRKAAALREAEKPVVVLCESREAERPRDLPSSVPVLSARASLKEVPKSTPGAVAAITLETGRQTWVQPQAWADAETKKALGQVIKAPKAKAGAAPAAATGASAAKQAALRQAKRFTLRLQAIGEAKEKAKQPPLADLLRLVVVLIREDAPVRSADTWERIADTKRSEADDRDSLWTWVCEKLPHYEYERVMSTALPDLEAVQAMEGLVGIDPEHAGVVALAAVPEPEPKVKRGARAEQPGSGKTAKPRAKGKARKAKPAKAAKAKGRKRGAA